MMTQPRTIPRSSPLQRLDLFGRRRTAGSLLGAVLMVVLVLYAYLHDLGRNPFGLFADEALIGVRTRDFVQGTLPSGSHGLFFDHFGTVAGALPIYAAAPFVWLLGLSEYSLRLASASFILATALVLWLTFRLLGLRSPWLPSLMFVLSPVVVHVGRINFGHAPSLFLIAAGYLLYLLGRTRQRLAWAALGGALIGISAYGYPGFYIAAPVFLGILAATELVFICRERCGVRTLLVVLVFALLCMSPIVHEAFTNPDFMNRLEDKDQTGIEPFSLERLTNMLMKYPEYFSGEYLFASGETGLPGAFITRHSVTGAGLLYWIVLPLLVLGVLSLLIGPRDPRKRAFAPFVVLAVLFPLPSLFTASLDSAPYTFSVVTGILCVPFLVAFGLETLSTHRASRLPMISEDPLALIWSRLISVPVITTMVLISGFFFVFATYARYPLGSSDFWGWQAGPREMMTYFEDNQNRYDAFVVEGAFNEPDIFLDFYLDDPAIRERAEVDEIAYSDQTPNTLFSVSRETYDNKLTHEVWKIDHTIYYPNGQVAFYLIRYIGE